MLKDIRKMGHKFVSYTWSLQECKEVLVRHYQVIISWPFKSGVNNSNLKGGKKNWGAYPRAKIEIFVPIQMMFFQANRLKWMKFWTLRAKYKASAGRMLCTSDLNTEKEVVKKSLI